MFIIGKTVELDPMTVERIPVADDTSTPGNEGIGIIACDSIASCDITENNCCTRAGNIPLCSPSTCSAEWFNHQCDGPEDCETDEACCGQLLEHENSCMSVTECASTPPCETGVNCDDQYGQRCHIDDDCPGDSYCDAHGGCHRVPVDDPATPGDDRPGYVECASDVCEPEEICCVDPIGTDSCQQPDFPDCGGRFYYDGPEDCAAGEKCCADENQTY